MAKLYISEGGKEAVYELFDDSPEVTVGRGASNAIQIADAHASKVHFVLRRIRARWKVVDLESKNGTRVNGAYHNAHWLSQNDTLTVGAVVLRFDSEGEPSGPPPRSAVPVAVAAAVAAPPRAVAAAPAAAQPVRMAAAPVAPMAAAPAAPPRPPQQRAAPAPAPGPARGPSRRRDDDDDDDRDERPRRQKPSGMPGAVIGGLIIIGAGLLLLIVFQLMSGEDPNVNARRQAQKLRDKGNYQAALDLLKSQSDPRGDNYGKVEDEIKALEALLGGQAKEARYNEALDYFKKNIQRWVSTGPSWNPKDHVSEKEAAQRLREFVRLYGDTGKAKEVINAKDDTNAAYQRILRENPEEGRDDKKAWGELDASVSAQVNTNHLGAAYGLLSFSLQFERLNLPPAAYTSFELRVKERQQQLKETAKAMVQKALGDASMLAKRGEGRMAKASVEAILNIIDWPDPELRRFADEGMRGW
jgi:hypothetical protein